MGWAAQIAGLLFAVFVIVSDVEGSLRTVRLEPGVGTIGAIFDTSSARDGWVTPRAIRPGGGLADAGITLKDRVSFDRPSDDIRYLRAGETIGLTAIRKGRAVHITLVARPWPTRPLNRADVLALTYGLATTLAALFGAYIIWRSKRNLTTMALGGGLLGYSLTTLLPGLWFSGDSVIFASTFGLGMLDIAAIPILFYAFALGFFRDNGGSPGPRETALFWGVAAVQVLFATASGLLQYFATSLPLIADGQLATVIVSYLGLGLCLVYLARGWRRAAAEVRQRYTLMLVATAAIMVAQSLDLLESVPSLQQGWYLAFNEIAGSILAGVVAPGLFTYSILRHRVLDLGFAVNRTLVYGLVSAILLVGFGLVEWASDHLLPLGGREKSAIVDAAVALAIFLTFHRLRDAVEHAVETLFFRAWREKEAALRTFVGEAAYILKPKALAKSLVSALNRYTDGASAALYLRDQAGDYVRSVGAVARAPATIDPDHPALVALRARRAALEEEALPRLGEAVLALPMVNRAEVTGFVLMGAKASGLAFRPDEVELLSWAVNQVGLDLHTLRIEHLEAVAVEQRQEIALLRARDGFQPAAG